ncbi:hypothetical protein ACFY6U_01015 [Streptomyces sp. NPDC013157]|uniref:hypothetical protein n=1 Tax=Streptomyces sp. NPDC013157 TaxID=3364861 RepID=UPI0036B3DFF7
MSAPAPLRTVESSGAEALWPQVGGMRGRSAYAQWGPTVIRPFRHVRVYGCPVAPAWHRP